MPRQEQIKAIEKNREVVTLASTQAMLRLGSAALVRVHIQTPMKALFRFNALLMGGDGKRYCYIQLPTLSVQQKGQYFHPGYCLQLHGVAPDGALVRFGGKIESILEGPHTLLCVEVNQDKASATPLRQDKRFPVQLSASFVVDNTSSVRVMINDISVGGCLFTYSSAASEVITKQRATLELHGIASNQDLSMLGYIISHRKQDQSHSCGFQFDERSKSRSAWLIANLNFDGVRFCLSVPNNDGELTDRIS